MLPEPEQLIRKFIAKYDFDPRQTMQLREDYGKRAASESWICLYYHAKTKAMSKVLYDEQGFHLI